jgi:protein SCO1
MMKWATLVAASVLVSGATAFAGFNPADLDGIAAVPAPDAALPLSLSFRDEAGRSVTLADALAGRPAVLIFADYTCRTLCGPILSFAAAGLAQSGLQAGIDYRLVVIGLDPHDGLDAARDMKSARFGDDAAIAQAAVFLTGQNAAIRAATDALGYRYAYDAEHDQFAHPAAAYILDPAGHVRRVLAGLGLSGADLRLALVDAGQGSVGTLADQVRLLCYGYDPVRGLYTERISRVLELACGLTVLSLAGGILLMAAHTRRKAAS